MHQLYNSFISLLDNTDKEGCVSFVLSRLDSGEIDVPILYTEILTPALNQPFCQSEQEIICIWEEHTRSSIIRTIIECCYPYIVKERTKKLGTTRKGKAIVVCPTQELHEIGARMIADFFTLAGFETSFIGANTPQDEIIEAIGYVNPDYVSISVSASYNLVAARKAIEHIIEVRQKSNEKFKIIVGGHAFDRNPELAGEMGADLHLKSLQDILNLGEAT